MPVITYPERVLVVLNPDGTLRGAHVERLQRIEEAGEVLAEKQLPAEPLDATSLAAVLPDTAALLAQVAALTAQLAEAEEARDAALAKVPPASSALTCNPAQIRLALNQAGLRDSLEAAVAAGPLDLIDLWQYSPVFAEDDPRVVAMAAAIGVDAAGLHDLFALAVTL